jgi:hypothetical protein
MPISKARARSVKHAVLAGEEQASGVLDAVTTVEIVELTGPASKVTVQTSDTLAVTVEYSCNGSTFFGSQAAAAGVPVSYTAHLVGAVKITRTAGSGRATILGA